MNKRNEAIKLLRDMTEPELDDHLRQQRRKLFEMRFQQATGQVEDHRQIRVIRREIARTMTVQIEAQEDAVLADPVRRHPKQRQEPPAKTENLSLSEVDAHEAADGDVDE